MKKTLIAVAALAAVSAASAQSSLNLYGIADVVIHKDKNVSTKMLSGGVSTSRIGFKGTEDLGGGLKANFLFEQGIDLNNGALKGNGFDRQAYVGLSGGFGEVKLGNVYTAYDDISGATNPVFDSVLSPNNSVWSSTGYTSNPGSNIYYATPSFGGVSGAVSYNLDGTKKPVKSVHVKYEGGPVYVGAAYQDERDLNGTRFARLNGSYDLGSFKLLAGYGKVSGGTTEYSLGADVPLSANMVLSAGYASSKTDGAARKSGLGLGVAYLLSKRTTVYGGFLDTKNVGPDTRYGAGLKHTF